MMYVFTSVESIGPIELTLSGGVSVQFGPEGKVGATTKFGRKISKPKSFVPTTKATSRLSCCLIHLTRSRTDVTACDDRQLHERNDNRLQTLKRTLCVKYVISDTHLPVTHS